MRLRTKLTHIYIETSSITPLWIRNKKADVTPLQLVSIKRLNIVFIVHFLDSPWFKENVT